jgi:hypothetical protein
MNHASVPGNHGFAPYSTPSASTIRPTIMLNNPVTKSTTGVPWPSLPKLHNPTLTLHLSTPRLPPIPAPTNSPVHHARPAANLSALLSPSSRPPLALLSPFSHPPTATSNSNSTACTICHEPYRLHVLTCWAILVLRLNLTTAFTSARAATTSAATVWWRDAQAAIPRRIRVRFVSGCCLRRGVRRGRRCLSSVGRDRGSWMEGERWGCDYVLELTPGLVQMGFGREELDEGCVLEGGPRSFGSNLGMAAYSSHDSSNSPTPIPDLACLIT